MTGADRFRLRLWPLLQAPSESEWTALARVRLDSQRERAGFAIAATLLVWFLFSTPAVLVWGGAQMVLIALERIACRRIEGGVFPSFWVAAVGLALVAGGNLSLALVLWPLGAGVGAAVASMFVVTVALSSLFTLRMKAVFMLAAVAPAVAILVVAPILAYLSSGDAVQLAAILGALFFVGFMIVVWTRLRDGDAAAAVAQADIAKARRAAERASDAKSAFLAAMSRELRTPMTAMLGAAALLQRADLSDDDRMNVETVLDAGQVLVAVLNDLLDTARIEAGRVSFTPAPTDLASLGRSVVQAWRPRADDKFLEIFCDIDRDAPPVAIVDSVRVKQILFNLVANAVKYTQHGGVRLRISATSPVPGRARYTFSVSDTGPGMEPELRASLFELKPPAPDSVESMFANGLGLAICRRLAVLMGGELEVDSAPGEGSTFRLILEATVAENIDGDADAGAWELFAKPLRILIADDHVVSRRVVGEMLRQMSAEVAFASDGAEALDLLRNTKFDLVLMDINMPVVDGIEATQRIRRERGMNQRVPILALTASTLGADRVRCLEAGMDGHISKPVDPAKFVAEVSRFTHRAAQAA
jgi:two-component system, sensor histidine kinase